MYSSIITGGTVLLAGEDEDDACAREGVIQEENAISVMTRATNFEQMEICAGNRERIYFKSTANK